MSWKLPVTVLAALNLLVSTAEARVTEIRIDAVEPFADGHAFGPAGAYERVKGIAKGELDPGARENAGIVELDKAPRNARGMVEYEVDIFILRPADPAKGSGFLYYEVLNRGNKQLGTRLLDVTSGGMLAALNDPKTPDTCRQRLRVRARLYRGLVGLGSGCVERECQDGGALPGGDGGRQADRAAHPRGVPGRQAWARRRRDGSGSTTRRPPMDRARRG